MTHQNTNSNSAPAKTPQASEIQKTAFWISGHIGKGMDAETLILLRNNLLGLAAQVESVEVMLEETLHASREMALDAQAEIAALEALVQMRTTVRNYARSRNPLAFVLNLPEGEEHETPRIFLCCPYSHPNWRIRAQRALEASEAAARLISTGYVVFSPLSHGHAVCEADTLGKVGTDAQAWAAINNAVLPSCHALALLDVPGLRESAGVRNEVTLAMGLGLPVNLVTHTGEGFDVEPGIDPMLFLAGEPGEGAA